MILVPGINSYIFGRYVKSDLFLIMFEGSKQPLKYKYNNANKRTPFF